MERQEGFQMRLGEDWMMEEDISMIDILFMSGIEED
jgi:hypothetical protein